MEGAAEGEVEAGEAGEESKAGDEGAASKEKKRKTTDVKKKALKRL